jgi:hypothetical protein
MGYKKLSEKGCAHTCFPIHEKPSQDPVQGNLIQNRGPYQYRGTIFNKKSGNITETYRWVRLSGRDYRPSRAFSPLVFQDKRPWFQMSTEAMQAALMLEHLKAVMGKTRPKRVEALLGF